MATDKLRVYASTDCCLPSGLHNSEDSEAPTENSGFNVFRNGLALETKRLCTLSQACTFSTLKCMQCTKIYACEGTLPVSQSSVQPHTHTYTQYTRILRRYVRMIGQGGGWWRWWGSCCFNQKVKGEVKNLIPPPPDNYMSLGAVSHSDIPLYMTTSPVSGLLTISEIAGDRVRMFVEVYMFICAHINVYLRCHVSMRRWSR